MWKGLQLICFHSQSWEILILAASLSGKWQMLDKSNPAPYLRWTWCWNGPNYVTSSKLVFAFPLYLSESWRRGNTVKTLSQGVFPFLLTLVDLFGDSIAHSLIQRYISFCQKWQEHLLPPYQLLPHDMQPRPVWCDLSGTDVKLYHYSVFEFSMAIQGW